MSTESDRTTEQAPAPLRCRYLRCKEMFHSSPEDDAFASGNYWCSRTQEAFGPDGELCDRTHCCEGRGCFASG